MSGVSSTGGLGTVTQSVSIALVGIAIVCGQGEFAPRHGQVIIGQQGSVSADRNSGLIANPNFQITSVQGNVTVPTSGGQNVTVNITGEEAAFAQNVVIVGPTLLTGIASTSATGSMTDSRTVALTGSSSTVSNGSVLAGQDAEDTFISSAAGTPPPVISTPLVGTSITGSQGTFITSGKDWALVSGLIFITGAQKSPSPDRSVPLTGSSFTGVQQAIGSPGRAALTGSAVSVQQGSLGRAFAISGQSMTSSQGAILGLPGIVALNGQSMTLSQGVFFLGINWDQPSEPTTAWTATTPPTSAWTQVTDPSTTWTKT